MRKYTLFWCQEKKYILNASVFVPVRYLQSLSNSEQSKSHQTKACYSSPKLNKLLGKFSPWLSIACKRVSQSNFFLTRRPSQASPQEDNEETEQSKWPFWTILFSILKQLFPRFPLKIDRVQQKLSRSVLKRKNTVYSFLKSSQNPTSFKRILVLEKKTKMPNHKIIFLIIFIIFILLFLLLFIIIYIFLLLHLEWHYKNMPGEKEKHIYLLWTAPAVVPSGNIGKYH